MQFLIQYNKRKTNFFTYKVFTYAFSRLKNPLFFQQNPSGFCLIQQNPEGFCWSNLNLNDLESFNKNSKILRAETSSDINQFKLKSVILYKMPIYEAQFLIKNAPCNSIPLGEFVKSNSTNSFQEMELRKCLYKLVPVLHKDPKPLNFNVFSSFFDDSLKESIEFQLKSYFSYAYYL